jgi:NAD(P)H-dependent flavin oxidoreductase YrpB (nitropropane dioxygenase family)
MSRLNLHTLRHPIVQVPMAGGPSTPWPLGSLAPEGLGFLAAGYKTIDQVERELAEVRFLFAGRRAVRPQLVRPRPAMGRVQPKSVRMPTAWREGQVDN